MKGSESSPARELEKPELQISFIPIICSAPLIYAHSHGFFEKNGLKVTLRPAPGWSGIKELIVHGLVDAVHMLSPMPLACRLGIDGRKADIRLAAIQNVNGQALTLARKHVGIKDVRDMKGFTFGVPYRFSMHYYLLCYFLAENGVNPLKDVPSRRSRRRGCPTTLKKAEWTAYLRRSHSTRSPCTEALDSFMFSPRTFGRATHAAALPLARISSTNVPTLTEPC